MTQTEMKTEQPTDEIAVDQLVRIKDVIGWYWVIKTPEDPNGTYILYGGHVARNGVFAKTRCVGRDKIELITTPGKLRKARDARHAIAKALSEAPQVSQTRKPGRK